MRATDPSARGDTSNDVSRDASHAEVSDRRRWLAEPRPTPEERGPACAARPADSQASRLGCCTPRAGGASGRAQPARPSPASCAARRLGRRAGRPHHRAGLAPRAGELLVGEQVWHEIERWAPRRGSRARACRSRAHPALLRIPHHAHRRPRASAGCGLPVVSAADVASRFPATARPEARYCSKRCRQAARCASAQAALRSHRPSAALAARAPDAGPGVGGPRRATAQSAAGRPPRAPGSRAPAGELPAAQPAPARHTHRPARRSRPRVQ